MARKSGSGGIAAMVGRELGKLAARKDALAKQLATVEREIAAVRDSVTKALSAREIPFPKVKAKAKRGGRRALSAATRAKMAEAAKRRWAAVKKAGKNALS